MPNAMRKITFDCVRPSRSSPNRASVGLGAKKLCMKVKLEINSRGIAGNAASEKTATPHSEVQKTEVDENACPIACSPTPGSVSMIIFKGAFASFSAMALLDPLEIIVQKSELHVCEIVTNLIIGLCYEVVDVLRNADFRIQ